ncbi:hypothetical protein B0T10DRAFT_587447 [Thelonectria olida]|uniref:NACHT-NTPase and P-loop NTPases N-terminal domain-containing protein n=1 Tax=Thelonectria olida TaxID=1576542 RepID=A0A9P9AU48_9HYPO|nr:hypothetical protein B0T10DRAFT_587447 [Thelonectria olida]
MPPPSEEAKKAIKSLSRVISPVRDTITIYEELENTSDLPKAFQIVAKWLPLVADIFSSMKSQLENASGIQEAEEAKRSYAEIKCAADECRDMAYTLETHFETIKKADGKRLEEVMSDLLCRIDEVVEEPMVNEDMLRELEEAMGDMRKLAASLEDDEQKHHVITNKGNGVMPVHLGRGDQRIHTGSGPQFNGQSAQNTFNYGHVPAAELAVEKPDEPGK